MSLGAAGQKGGQMSAPVEKDPRAASDSGAVPWSRVVPVLVVLLAGFVFGWKVAAVLAVWLGMWWINARLAAGGRSSFVVPAVFGLTLLGLWQLVVTLFGVPAVILPPPSAIAARFATEIPTLWVDFVQTIIKGALSGYLIGCGAAVATAVLIDRSPFLQRGLLPVGNFVAALPIIGVAPILVMWFGFDWQSKAAVVVIMVFFPVLVNTVAGLSDTSVMQRDLMKTYSASYWQSLVKLRLPAAMPFIFNGLKIATTLALIGAIVAEFFGSPIKGMGFRISTEVGRLGLDMVWAEITVAALTGSAFYGLVGLIEKRMTFWHPSQRGE
jgi:NitT/TauT family transport system permease protein